MKRLGDFLNAITKLEPRNVLGLMSGTSADGIDAALCRIHGHGQPNGKGLKGARAELLHFERSSYSGAVKDKLKKGASLSIEELSDLNIEIGEEFGAAALRCIEKSGQDKTSVALIGSHGQTVFHHSGNSSIKATLQIGDGDVIADRVGITTISDFRMRDVAAKGEGAPLTPYADPILFGAGPKIILNLGGIANITVIGEKGKIIGFDTGPANAPLDRVVSFLTNGSESFDRDGKRALSGTINKNILEKLISQDKFIAEPYPKSTGTEKYGDEFTKGVIKLFGSPSSDVLATLCEFIAKAVAAGIKLSGAPESSMIVCAGGGSQNRYLLERIRENLSPREVRVSDEFGVPWFAREAMAFAILANDALFSLPTSLPSVTGAARGSTLGKLSFPPCSFPSCTVS